jgi:hypothetical protein
VKPKLGVGPPLFPFDGGHDNPAEVVTAMNEFLAQWSLALGPSAVPIPIAARTAGKPVSPNPSQAEPPEIASASVPETLAALHVNPAVGLAPAELHAHEGHFWRPVT